MILKPSTEFHEHLHPSGGQPGLVSRLLSMLVQTVEPGRLCRPLRWVMRGQGPLGAPGTISLSGSPKTAGVTLLAADYNKVLRQFPSGYRHLWPRCARVCFNSSLRKTIVEEHEL